MKKIKKSQLFDFVSDITKYSELLLVYCIHFTCQGCCFGKKKYTFPDT